jgi:hypothetical protein
MGSTRRIRPASALWDSARIVVRRRLVSVDGVGSSPVGSHTVDLSAPQKLIDTASAAQGADRELPSEVVHARSLPAMNER